MSPLVLWAFIAASLIGTSLLSGPRDTGVFLASRGLPLTPFLRAEVERRLVARRRGSLTWGLGGWAVGVLIGAMAGGSAPHAVSMLIVAPTLLGSGIGRIWGIARSTAPLDPAASRVARARAVGWRDYCTPRQRMAVALAGAGIVLACATAALVYWMGPLRPGGSALILLLGVGVVCLAFDSVLILAAVILGNRPQHAGDALALAWDDALRSSAMRDLLALIVGASVLAEIVIVGQACSWLITPEARALDMNGTLVLGMGAGAVLLLCCLAALVPWALEPAQPDSSPRAMQRGCVSR